VFDSHIYVNVTNVGTHTYIVLQRTAINERLHRPFDT